MNKIKTSRGFSLLEILLAIMIISVGITSAVVLAMGGQESVRDAGISQTALYKIDEGMEQAFAALKGDWSSLSASAVIADGVFTKETEVVDISPCVKQVTSSADWDVPQRSLFSTITSLFTSTTTAAALGGDCNTTPPGNWGSPDFYDNPEIIHSGSSAMDVDAIKNSKGVFALIATAGSGDTFWVVDVNDPDNPISVGEFDTDDNSLAIDAYTAGDIAYAFLATASTTAQMQVMKVDFSLYPGVNPTITRVSVNSLPGVSDYAQSIYLYDSNVYVGTPGTAGPEFHIFNASNPEAPTFLGSVDLATDVNDIVVSDTYAYLATSDNDSELCIIDISLPGSMSDCEDVLGMQFNTLGNQNATAIDVLGNNVYLGRERVSSGHDFYIIDVTDLINISYSGRLNLGLNPNTEVTGLVAASQLVFMVTSDQNYSGGGGPFMVYDVSDPSNITLVSTCAINFSEKSTGIDYLDDTVFVSNESNDALRIMFPTPSCTP
jgi:prepilin-type N-terminal cleavage/methylation domain-containing protein